MTYRPRPRPPLRRRGRPFPPKSVSLGELTEAVLASATARRMSWVDSAATSDSCCSPEVDRRGAATVAEALPDAVACQPVPIGGRELTVTVSVGWAIWQGEDEEQLLDRADRALYAAKHGQADPSARAIPADRDEDQSADDR